MSYFEIIKNGLNNFLIKDKRERYVGFISKKNISKYYNDLSHSIENYLLDKYKCNRAEFDYSGKWIITGQNSIEESNSNIDDIIADCEDESGGFFIFSSSASIGIYISESPSNIVFMKK